MVVWVQVEKLAVEESLKTAQVHSQWGLDDTGLYNTLNLHPTMIGGEYNGV